MKIVNLMLLSLLCGVIALPSGDVNAGIFRKKEAGKKHGGRSQGMSNSSPEGQTIAGVAGGPVRKLSPIPPK